MRTIIITLLLLVTAHTANAVMDVFDDFYDHMRYLNARDKVISSNIANSNTAKYKPKDIKKNRKNDAGIKLATSSNMHIDIEGENQTFRQFNSRVDEIKRNGNAVNLDRELFNKSENAIQLNEAVKVYNKAKSMMNTAVMGAGK